MTFRIDRAALASAAFVALSISAAVSAGCSHGGGPTAPPGGSGSPAPVSSSAPTGIAFQDRQRFVVDTYWNGRWAAGLAVADLNGDGSPDVAGVLGNTNAGNTVVTLLGDGRGGLGSTRRFDTATYPTASCVAEVDRDGKLDVVVAGRGGISVFLGDGTGGFALRRDTADASAAGDTCAVAVADVNGDGSADVIVGRGTSTLVAIDGPPITPVEGGFSVFLGDGTGKLRAGASATTGDVVSLRVADIDGDGAPDLVLVHGVSALVKSSTAEVVVLRNDGRGAFARVSRLATDAGDVAIADVDADGRVDLIAAAGDGIAVYQGKGDGTFGAARTFSLPRISKTLSAIGIALADLDRDGHQDVVLLLVTKGSYNDFSQDGYYVGTFTGDGRGAFTAGGPASWTENAMCGPLAVGDLDREGRTDVVVGASGGIAIFLRK